MRDLQDKCHVWAWLVDSTAWIVLHHGGKVHPLCQVSRYPLGTMAEETEHLDVFRGPYPSMISPESISLFPHHGARAE